MLGVLAAGAGRWERRGEGLLGRRLLREPGCEAARLRRQKELHAPCRRGAAITTQCRTGVEGALRQKNVLHTRRCSLLAARLSVRNSLIGPLDPPSLCCLLDLLKEPRLEVISSRPFSPSHPFVPVCNLSPSPHLPPAHSLESSLTDAQTHSHSISNPLITQASQPTTSIDRTHTNNHSFPTFSL